MWDGLKVGVHDDRPPAAVLAAFPGATVTRRFVGPGVLPQDTDLAARIADAAKPTWAAGGLPVVSLKLRPAEVNAGVWDTSLRALGWWLAGQPDTVVVPWHEPEDDHATPTAAKAYVAAFNHARALLKQGCPALVVAYCAMGYQWRPGATATADPAIWRGIDADLYLCDVYSGKSFPASAILPEHAGFRRWKAEIVDKVPGRRWGVGERGILAHPTRAATWARERDWLAAEGTCALYMAWNTAGTENDPRWVMRDTESGTGDLAAVRQLVAAMSIPVGYAPAPVGTAVLVCQRTGALVARHLAAEHKAWLDAVGPAA